MSKKNKVFIVTIHRWGDEDSHSYIKYVGSLKRLAIKAGDEEKSWRGGKYEYEITEFIVNDINSRKIIKRRDE